MYYVFIYLCFRSKHTQPESNDNKNKEIEKNKGTETAQPKAARSTNTKFIKKSSNISRDTKDLAMSLGKIRCFHAYL